MAQNYDDRDVVIIDSTPAPRLPNVRVPIEDQYDTIVEDEDRPQPRKRYALRLAVFAASLIALAFVFVGSIFALTIYSPDRVQLLLQQARTAFDGTSGQAEEQLAAAQPPTTSTAQRPFLVAQGSQPKSTANLVADASTKAGASPEVAQLPIPNVDGLVMLIRRSLNAFNQANQTGNYSILRELSGSDFQKANSGARLNEAFAEFRGRHVDLLAVNVLNPLLVREPWIDDEGYLRLIGFFPSRPEQINFEMIFQPEDGTWLLFGLAVDTSPPAAEAPQTDESAQMPPVAAREPPPKAPLINRQPQMPSEATAVALVRGAMIALNQANATGNYSVLRELGAPGFQQLNTSAQLADAFTELRRRQLDLTPVTVIPPAFTSPPVIDEAGRLRLTGGFPSRPEQVNFDMLFQLVDGTWKIFGLGVNTSRLVPAGTADPSTGNDGVAPGGQAPAQEPASSTTSPPTPTPRARPGG